MGSRRSAGRWWATGEKPVRLARDHVQTTSSVSSLGLIKKAQPLTLIGNSRFAFAPKCVPGTDRVPLVGDSGKACQSAPGPWGQTRSPVSSLGLNKNAQPLTLEYVTGA
jgi:hypothetical protein